MSPQMNVRQLPHRNASNSSPIMKCTPHNSVNNYNPSSLKPQSQLVSSFRIISAILQPHLHFLLPLRLFHLLLILLPTHLHILLLILLLDVEWRVIRVVVKGIKIFKRCVVHKLVLIQCLHHGWTLDTQHLDSLEDVQNALTAHALQHNAQSYKAARTSDTSTETTHIT